MELPSLDPSHSAEQLFTDINAYIDDAQKLLAENQIVSLAGLDTVVAALCKRIVGLEHAQGVEYASELKKLLARMGDLQDGMNKAKAEVITAIKTLGKHHKAARAYLSTPEK
jgi:hypothetical protein